MPDHRRPEGAPRRGTLPAVPVTLDCGGRLHAAAHDLTSHMSEQPLAVLAVWAHTGRGLVLEPRDLRRGACGDWRAALPAQGPSSPSRLRRSGAPRRRPPAPSDGELAAPSSAPDAVLAYAPTWLRGREHADRLIVEHHRRLAAARAPPFCSTS